MLPDFLIIGAAKCGTTSVYHQLGEHPEVFVPDRKEPYFFARESLAEFRDWYESLFDGARGARAIGEASVLYSHPRYARIAAARIATHLPDARLIYMVRHPVRRLESDWMMRSLEGYEPGPVESAIEKFPDLIEIGMYWEHLSAFREYFLDEQILIVFLEDLARSPREEIRRIFEHLGVDPSFVPGAVDEPRNTAATRRRAEAAKALGPLAPLARKAKKWIPGPIQDLGARLLTPASLEAEPAWRPEALAAVRGIYHDDARALLSHCGKPLDFWNLENAGSEPPDSQLRDT